jgi:hypothetical protein
MTTYTCPTCMQSIDRDLLVFIKHTDVHIEEVRRAVLYKRTHHPSRLKAVFRSVVVPLGVMVTRLAFTFQGRCT